MNYEVLPWHAAQWQLVSKQRQHARLPHALLLSGPKDLGKRQFGERLAALLLCRSPDGDEHCGECSSCHLLSAGSHPDFRLLTPEDSKMIKVDQIRELTEWAAQTAQQGGEKVALFYPADQMNVQASNALLKSLEEPASHTLFMLISDQPAKLLPTIRSRCQKLSFQVPDTTLATNWLHTRLVSREDSPREVPDLAQVLSLAAGSPLRAEREVDAAFLDRRQTVFDTLERLLKRNESGLTAAASLQKCDPLEFVGMLQTVINDAIKRGVGAATGLCTNRDRIDVIDQLVQARDLSALHALSDKAQLAKKELEGTSNPNPQLLMESLLIACAGVPSHSL